MIVLQDNFHGANEPLANHAPQVGGPWNLTAGNFNIAGNVAVAVDDSGALNTVTVDPPDLGNIAIAGVSGVLTLAGSQALRNVVIGLNNGTGSVDLTLNQSNQAVLDYQEGSGPYIYAEAEGNFPPGNYPFSIKLSGGTVKARIGDITLQGQIAQPTPPMTGLSLTGHATAGNVVSFRGITVQGQTRS